MHEEESPASESFEERKARARAEARNHDEADAAVAAIEEESNATGYSPPTIGRAIEAREHPAGYPGEQATPEDWPGAAFVLGGHDHGRDAVELRVRHVERGALIEARGTLGRLRIVVTEFMERLDGLASLEDPRHTGAFVADLNSGREFLDTAIDALQALEVEEAANDVVIAATHLLRAAETKIDGLSGEAAVAKEALRSVSVQARRSAVHLRMAVAMRALTHEEALMLETTSSLDAATMIQARASHGMHFSFKDGLWTVRGVPGAAIKHEQFGGALALALTRLKRA